MRCLVLALCACAAPHAAPEPTRETVKPQVYCPAWETAVVGELFPGCGDLPMAGIPCGQATCDRPCSVTIESTQAAASTYGFEYDAAGHYIRSQGGDSMTCSYDRGKRVRCASPQASIMIERDARGRITKLLEEHTSGEYETKPVRYDRRGRVVAIGKVSYEYDDRGQLVRVDDKKLVWKDRAHVDGNWLGRAATFEYDERDRLVKIDLDAEGTEIRFEWEAARLLSVKVLGPEGTTTSTYRYDCR